MNEWVINDKKNIFWGSARVVIADEWTVLPATIDDVIDPATNLPKTWYTDLGATDGGVSMERGWETEEWTVDQVIWAVDTYVTATNVSLTVPMAEMSLANLKLAWGLGAETVDAPNSQTIVDISDLDEESRVTKQVLIIGGKRDGKRRMYVWRRAQWDLSSSTISFIKWEKQVTSLVLKCLASTVTADAASKFGKVYDEDNAA